MEDRNLIKGLMEIVGEESVSQSVFVRANYATKPAAIHLFQENLPEAVVRPESAQKVSRFLRHANEPPRKLLRSIPGLILVEMERSKKGSLCCGGGGGRMWTDFTEEKRLSEKRTEEALEVDA